MAQIFREVTHIAEIGDVFRFPYQPRVEVSRVRDLGLQIEYLLEDGNGQRYSMLVDKPEVEFSNSERDRFECGGEVYYGVS